MTNSVCFLFGFLRESLNFVPLLLKPLPPPTLTHISPFLLKYLQGYHNFFIQNLDHYKVYSSSHTFFWKIDQFLCWPPSKPFRSDIMCPLLQSRQCFLYHVHPLLHFFQMCGFNLILFLSINFALTVYILNTEFLSYS